MNNFKRDFAKRYKKSNLLQKFLIIFKLLDMRSKKKFEKLNTYQKNFLFYLKEIQS